MPDNDIRIHEKGSNRRLESGLYVTNKRRRDVLPLRTYGLTPLRFLFAVYVYDPNRAFLTCVDVRKPRLLIR
jgi:hypothetical protein